MKRKVFDDQYIVITGAAGFIGSGVVQHLNEQGFSNLVLVDDFKATSKWKNLVGKKYIDLVSRYDLFDWLQGKEQQIEAFIHLGACSSTVETDGDYIVDNNFRYSVELAEYAIKNNHRFIYASSAATYGTGSFGYIDQHDQIDQLRPLNLYGYSKQMFDQWLYRTGNIEHVVGLKYFNIFGPNEEHKGRMASMVYHMSEAIRKDGVVKLFASNEPETYADGEQCRDFLYVKDAVRITCSFLENNLTGIYNVGSGKTTTWNELANAVFQAFEREPSIEYIPMPGDLIGKYQNYTCADMQKYASKMQEAKLEPIKPMSIQKSVREYVQDYLLKEAKW